MMILCTLHLMGVVICTLCQVVSLSTREYLRSFFIFYIKKTFNEMVVLMVWISQCLFLYNNVDSYYSSGQSFIQTLPKILKT